MNSYQYHLNLYVWYWTVYHECSKKGLRKYFIWMSYVMYTDNAEETKGTVIGYFWKPVRFISNKVRFVWKKNYEYRKLKLFELWTRFVMCFIFITDCLSKNICSGWQFTSVKRNSGCSFRDSPTFHPRVFWNAFVDDIWSSFNRVNRKINWHYNLHNYSLAWKKPTNIKPANIPYFYLTVMNFYFLTRNK